MVFDSLLSVSTPEVHFMNSSKMTSCIHDRHTRLPLRCRDSLCLLRCLSEALHHLFHLPDQLSAHSKHVKNPPFPGMSDLCVCFAVLMKQTTMGVAECVR